MSIERIIGIDFGTSTSVIRVKRYQDGRPVGDHLYAAEVTFNSMGQSLVPTLIQKLQDGEPYYGYEAQKARKKSTFFQNFKIDLESPDPGKRRQARSLTEEFFAYMAKQYRDQSSGGFLGEFGDVERTLISYPVKWSEETRAFMLDAARKAGFPNVEGMDEAQAAITAVMVQSADHLSKKGYLYDGTPVNILMADMGAGTTDLVLCRYTPGKSAGYEVLSVWPKDGNMLFGGGEMEVLLQDYLRSKLPEEDADMVMRQCRLEKFKSWKEDYVSPALSRGETVTECSELEVITDLLEIDVEDYVLDRAEFERLAGNYLKGFPELVNGCLKDAGIAGSDVDLVLLTGGHSQWYFVREQLKGALRQCGEIDLGKIESDSGRIISVPRPQETVALGLVYSPLMKEIDFARKITQKPVQQSEAQVEVKVNSQLVDKPKIQTNTESDVWDEFMRVLPLTPEEEFEFGETQGGYQVKRYTGKRELISIPARYKGKLVVGIGSFSFSEGKYIHRQIEIPGSVQIICYGAFEGNHLEKVIFHTGIKKIMERAFSHAHLNSIELPKSITTIDNYAFSDNDLRVIHVPVNCTFIGMGAFAHNFQLDEVKFQSKSIIQKLDEYAFWGTNVLQIKVPANCKCDKLIRQLGKSGEPGGFFRKAIPPTPPEYIQIERF